MQSFECRTEPFQIHSSILALLIVAAMSKNLEESVVSNEDFLGEICKFLRLEEIFGIVSVLSNWHYQFLNNPQRKTLIGVCLDRETRAFAKHSGCSDENGNFDPEAHGLTRRIDKILKKLDIELQYHRQDHPHKVSLSAQINTST